MKQYLLVTILCVILFSCRKEQTSSLAPEITGKWQYLKTVSPEITLAPPPDTAVNIFIGNDGSFERRYNDSLLFKGSYSLIEKKDCYEDEKKLLFKTSDQAGDGDYIKINNDTLILSTPNCYMDGAVTFYIKK